MSYVAIYRPPLLAFFLAETPPRAASRASASALSNKEADEQELNSFSSVAFVSAPSVASPTSHSIRIFIHWSLATIAFIPSLRRNKHRAVPSHHFNCRTCHPSSCCLFIWRRRAAGAGPRAACRLAADLARTRRQPAARTPFGAWWSASARLAGNGRASRVWRPRRARSRRGVAHARVRASGYIIVLVWWAVHDTCTQPGHSVTCARTCTHRKESGVKTPSLLPREKLGGLKSTQDPHS